MKDNRFTITSLLILLLSVSAGLGQQRLLVVGGGKRPADAMKTFVGWSGGKSGKILIVTWATTEPEESYQGLKKELDTYGIEAVHAPMPPFDQAKRTVLINEISSAKGVFFGGG